MARRRPVRIVTALLATVALVVLGTLGSSSAAACSGAPGVGPADLESSFGRIVVAKVVERSGRSPGPRGVLLAVQENLRGAGPDLIELQRPRQAMGVCHDVFTVWRNARVLIAFDVFPLAGGGPLMPAWTVRKDGTLAAIYDDPPWANLDLARTALAATSEPPMATADVDDLPVVVTLLAGVGVLLAAMAAGTRSRRRVPVLATAGGGRISPPTR